MEMSPSQQSRTEAGEKSYKTGFDGDDDDARRRRDADILAIWQNKREERLLKKRRKEQLARISLLVQAIWSDDPLLQQKATIEFAKMLTIESSPLIDEIINAGVIPRFVEFLGRNYEHRLQDIKVALPPLEKAVLAQTSHLHFCYTAGSEWHPRIRKENNHFIYNDLPRFIMDSYEECRDPPRLHMLDRFDTGGLGSCLKRYSDPTFFKRSSSKGHSMDAYRLQLKLFLYELKQQQLLFGVRTFLKVYSTISLGKLATYMDMDEPTLRTILIT